MGSAALAPPDAAAFLDGFDDLPVLMVASPRPAAGRVPSITKSASLPFGVPLRPRNIARRPQSVIALNATYGDTFVRADDLAAAAGPVHRRVREETSCPAARSAQSLWFENFKADRAGLADGADAEGIAPRRKLCTCQSPEEVWAVKKLGTMSSSSSHPAGRVARAARGSRPATVLRARISRAPCGSPRSAGRWRRRRWCTDDRRGRTGRASSQASSSGCGTEVWAR